MKNNFAKKIKVFMAVALTAVMVFEAPKLSVFAEMMKIDESGTDYITDEITNSIVTSDNAFVLQGGTFNGINYTGANGGETVTQDTVLVNLDSDENHTLFVRIRDLDGSYSTQMTLGYKKAITLEQVWGTNSDNDGTLLEETYGTDSFVLTYQIGSGGYQRFYDFTPDYRYTAEVSGPGAHLASVDGQPAEGTIAKFNKGNIISVEAETVMPGFRFFAYNMVNGEETLNAQQISRVGDQTFNYTSGGYDVHIKYLQYEATSQYVSKTKTALFLPEGKEVVFNNTSAGNVILKFGDQQEIINGYKKVTIPRVETATGWRLQSVSGSILTFVEGNGAYSFDMNDQTFEFSLGDTVTIKTAGIEEGMEFWGVSVSSDTGTQEFDENTAWNTFGITLESANSMECTFGVITNEAQAGALNGKTITPIYAKSFVIDSDDMIENLEAGQHVIFMVNGSNQTEVLFEDNNLGGNETTVTIDGERKVVKVIAPETSDNENLVWTDCSYDEETNRRVFKATRMAYSIMVSGTIVSLAKGTPYKLESGKTWQVSDDTTQYAGGITFYVDETKEYSFE